MSDIFKKYFVDDVINRHPDSQLSSAILLLEYQPKTGLSIRQKYADYVRNRGLIALADYLMQIIDYEKFAMLSKQEIPNRRRVVYQKKSDVETKLKILKKQESEIKQHLHLKPQQHQRECRFLQNKHITEQNELKKRQQDELLCLNKKHNRILSDMNTELQRIEHEIKLITDEQYAAAYREEQERQEEIERERKFLQSFGIHHVDEQHKIMLFTILSQLNQSKRLTNEQVTWLETKGKRYFDKQQSVYQMHHCLEAEYYVDLYQKDKRIWHLINASSHFRKANLAPKAHDLLLKQKTPKDTKSHSAFLTTFGGVKRDLGLFHDGINMAHEAHELAPKDYRPCTLLGALYFEIRQYNEGTEWFEKAEERGASKHNSDAEIKAIYHKANKEDKAKLKDYLLKLDPSRYAWLNSGQSKKKNK